MADKIIHTSKYTGEQVDEAIKKSLEEDFPNIKKEIENVSKQYDENLANKADKTDIPTKVSQLENDAKYVQLNNEGKIPESQLPENIDVKTMYEQGASPGSIQAVSPNNINNNNYEPKQSHAGMLGYYYCAISPGEEILDEEGNGTGRYADCAIWLTTQQPIDITDETVIYPKVETIPYEVNDVISIINDSKYPDCATITAIDTKEMCIVVDSLPFNTIENMKDNPTMDDYSIFVYEKHLAGEVPLGWYAVADGENCIAYERGSNARGRDTKAKGQYSDTSGRGTEAGYCGHAEMNKCKAGDTCHAEGEQTEATGGEGAHSQGKKTKAKGSASDAGGKETQANGEASTTRGVQTRANGKASRADGHGSVANGENSVADGNQTEAKGKNSQSHGERTVAGSDNQTVLGKLNVVDNDGKYIEIAGNGKYEDRPEEGIYGRSNAKTLDWEGTAWFAKKVLVGGSGQDDKDAKELATVEYVDSLVKPVNSTLQQLSDRVFRKTVSLNWVESWYFANPYSSTDKVVTDTVNGTLTKNPTAQMNLFRKTGTSAYFAKIDLREFKMVTDIKEATLKVNHTKFNVSITAAVYDITEAAYNAAFANAETGAFLTANLPTGTLVTTQEFAGNTTTPNPAVIDITDYLKGKVAAGADYAYIRLQNDASGGATTDAWRVSNFSTKSKIQLNFTSASNDDIIDAVFPMFPKATVTTAGKEITLQDAMADVNLIDYSITGSAEGVGELNEETGKYEIPVLLRTPNLIECNNPSKWESCQLSDLGYGYGNQQKYMVYALHQTADIGETITINYKLKAGATSSLRLYTNDTDFGETIGNTTIKLIIDGAYQYDSFTITMKSDCVYYLVYPTSSTTSGYNFEAWLENFEYISVTKEESKSVLFELDTPLGETDVLSLQSTGKQIAVPFSAYCKFYVDTAAAPSEFSLKYYQDINKMIEILNKKIAEVQALVLE